LESARMLAFLVSDEDVVVRTNAARWLRGLGFLALPYLEAIRRGLCDPEACVRVNVAYALWELNRGAQL